ncbi:MAG: hypothetical protein J6Q10_02570 [Clostridia bacterium]|nr:hypothetical protein [Clostridia bacterium]
MIKHFCDMCGKEITETQGADVVVSKKDYYGTLWFAQEVCIDCAKKLKKQFPKQESQEIAHSAAQVLNP